MAETDTDIANATEGVLETKELEAFEIQGVSGQLAMLEAKEKELLNKLLGFSQATLDCTVEFKSLMTATLNTMSYFISAVANKSYSTPPLWLADLCDVQYAYAPVEKSPQDLDAWGLLGPGYLWTGTDDTSAWDMTFNGPITESTVINSNLSVNYSPELNSGMQFPSTVVLDNEGPDRDLTLSIMMQKATVSYDRINEAADDYTSAAIAEQFLRQRCFSSSLGAWCIHIPFNGLVSNATGTPVNSIEVAVNKANDPYLRYGDVADEETKYSLYDGAGWGTGVGDGWGSNTYQNWPLGTDVIKEHYLNYVLNPSYTQLVVVQRSTGITASIDINSVAFDNSGQVLRFNVAFDSIAFFGEDMSSAGDGDYAFYCGKYETRAGSRVITGGSFDQTYGFTAFMAWNCFEKDDQGDWRKYPITGQVNPWPSGTPLFFNLNSDPERWAGSGMFINSESLYFNPTTLKRADARDIFYHVNVDDSTLQDRDFYRMNQLQGIYAGMIKDISSPHSGWSKQKQAIDAAKENSRQRAQVYLNDEVYAPEEQVGKPTKPIKPSTRYLELLKSSTGGVVFSIPVDTLHDGEINNGIKLTLVTGAMYKASNE